MALMFQVNTYVLISDHIHVSQMLHTWMFSVPVLFSLRKTSCAPFKIALWDSWMSKQRTLDNKHSTKDEGAECLDNTGAPYQPSPKTSMALCEEPWIMAIRKHQRQ